MTAIAQALYQSRKRLSDFLGIGVALLVAVLIGRGEVTLAMLWRGSSLGFSGVALFTFALCRVVAREVMPKDAPRLTTWQTAVRELELGLVLLAGAYLLLAMTAACSRFC